jgi:adenylate kinase family enzyme
MPVLDYYRERALLAEVPGVDTVEQINKRVMKALEL